MVLRTSGEFWSFSAFSSAFRDDFLIFILCFLAFQLWIVFFFGGLGVVELLFLLSKRCQPQTGTTGTVAVGSSWVAGVIGGV